MNLGLDLRELLEIINPETHNIPSNYSFNIRNVVLDSRSPNIDASTLFFAFKGDISDGHAYLNDFGAKGGKIAIVEELTSSTDVLQLKVQSSLKALQKLAAAHRKKFSIQVVGITGSNGKTIVKEWLYHLLSAKYKVVRSPKSFNSQIGVALSLLEIQPHHQIALIEAGISKPGEMDNLYEMIRPNIGVFTGLGEAHQLNFNSLEEKKIEKFKLFQSADKIYIPDLSEEIAKSCFSNKADLSNASIVSQIAKDFKLKQDEIEGKLRTVPSLSMRMEKHLGRDNSLLINDAYSADFNSFENAVQLLNQENSRAKKIVILSNFLESDFRVSDIDSILNASDIKELIFIGELPEQLTFKPVQIFENVDDFVNANISFKDTTVLLKGARNARFEKIVDHYLVKKHVTQLEVNLSAIRKNFRYFRNKIDQNTKLLAMVKAQAYGSGIVPIGKLLENEKADYLGVAFADEGKALREAGVKTPILVMNIEESAFTDIVNYKLEPSIYSIELLNDFVSHLILNNRKNYPIHIKVDTGMNRLGFQSDDLDELTDYLNAQPEVYIKSVFSHLAASDIEKEKEFTFDQIRKFEIYTEKIEYALGYEFERHIANTSSVLNYKKSHFDMVRMGIGLFGIGNNDLENAITFKSQVSQVKRIKKGESIGYARSFIATEDMFIGVIPVGYADGIRRDLGKKGFSLLVENERCEVIGTVCMDMLMVKLPNDKFKRGDKVEIFGSHIKIVDLAHSLNTIEYEILSGISDRVKRVYIDV